MKNNLYYIVLIFLVGCNSGNNYSENKALSNYREVESKIDSIYRKLNSNNLFNGEILVSHKNEIIIHKHYGSSNLISKERFNENSIFEIASLSKPFTLVAVSRLVEKKKLAFDDKVVKFIPELPYRDITIEQLITHTSGIPNSDGFFKDERARGEIITNDKLLELLVRGNIKLLFNPGEKWQYSNTGYIILAIIIERVTGKEFREACKELIFYPLGMLSTSIPSYTESMNDKNYVNDYIFNYADAGYMDPKVYPSFDNVTFTANMYGDQGICTNALDLYRFSKMFSKKDFISESTFEKFLSPRHVFSSSNGAYSFGWFVEMDSIAGVSLNHSGGYCGYRSIFQYFIDGEYLIIILSNIETPIYKLRDIITSCLFKRNIEIPRKSYVKDISFYLQKDKIGGSNVTELPSYDTLIHIIDYNEIDYLITDLIDNNEFQKAKIAAAKFIKEFPEYCKSYQYLGELYLKDGNTKESLELFEKVLELDSENTDVREMIDKLKN